MKVREKYLNYVLHFWARFELTFLSIGQDTLNDLVSPSSVIKFERFADLPSDIDFMNPVHDYIPPHLLECYVTNGGCFQPSYIYRLLSEYYHIDDWDSF